MVRLLYLSTAACVYYCVSGSEWDFLLCRFVFVCFWRIDERLSRGILIHVRQIFVLTVLHVVYHYQHKRRCGDSPNDFDDSL